MVLFLDEKCSEKPFIDTEPLHYVEGLPTHTSFREHKHPLKYSLGNQTWFFCLISPVFEGFILRVILEFGFW